MHQHTSAGHSRAPLQLPSVTPTHSLHSPAGACLPKQHLPLFQVLYLERTGLAAVPASAAPLLRQLRILSLDFFPLLTSAHLLREATRLQTL